MQGDLTMSFWKARTWDTDDGGKMLEISNGDSTVKIDFGQEDWQDFITAMAKENDKNNNS